MDDKTVTIIDSSGALSTCEPSFSAVKAALDGAFVTPISLSDGTLLVDEEGLMKRLPVNISASVLAGQALVGKVAFVPKRLLKKVLG